MRPMTKFFKCSAIKELQRHRCSRLTFSHQRYFSNKDIDENSLIFTPKAVTSDYIDSDNPTSISLGDSLANTNILDVDIGLDDFEAKKIGDIIDPNIITLTRPTLEEVIKTLQKLRVEFFYFKPTDEERDNLIRNPKSKLSLNSSIILSRRSNEGMAFHGRVVDDATFKIKSLEFFKSFDEFSERQQRIQVRLMLGTGYDVLRPEYQKALVDYLMKEEMDPMIIMLVKAMNQIEELKKSIEATYGIVKD